MAKDEVVESQTYEIMAGYYSPVYVFPTHSHRTTNAQLVVL